MKRYLAALAVALLLLVVSPAAAQSSGGSNQPPPVNAPSAEFLSAADEVLAEMSTILSLPQKAPLKKTLRTREEIRAYVLREFEEEKRPEKRYADQRAMEKFGLIPKGFPLQSFLVDLLTEQIAGLYDPKSREFFIADWIAPADQRMIMSHELTHALQDQYFDIGKWSDGAKENDDADLARHAVVEGSAFIAMMDWMFREQKLTVRGMPDLAPMLNKQMLGDLDKSPQFSKAPPFLRKVLLFPYLSGAVFSQRILQANTGWADFAKVFANPPVSTQQIMHPEVYLSGGVPQPVVLPNLAGVLTADWKKLDENVNGEFFLHAVLEQFAGAERADSLAPAWAGDRYALYEQEKTKRLLLVYRLRLESAGGAARLFGGLSESLEHIHENPRDLFRRPNYIQFDTDDGGVFLRCVNEECLLVDGATRAVYDGVIRAMGWSPAPAVPDKSKKEEVARILGGAPPAYWQAF
jgi:hypothetical protein